MSHLSFWYNSEENMDCNYSPMTIEDDMSNFDSPDLMQSEFFDSVLSMERENLDTESHTDCLDTNIDSSPESGILHMDDPTEFPQISIDDTTIPNFDIDTHENGKMISLETVPNESQIWQSPAKIEQIGQPKTKCDTVSKPVINKGGKKNTKNKQQVIRVQSLSANGRSLLLPVNMKNIKKIKILNASEFKMENIKISSPGKSTFQKKPSVDKCRSSSESLDDVAESEVGNNNRYPPLILSPEEKRLLLKEDITLPSHYPLTKNEEKELKRIRRKIRNKISAQDSRKRKKEYVDKLEEKAKRTSEENEYLKKRIKLLRSQNSRLMEQLSKLQSVLFNTTSSKATPATCLMIVLFSTLLICLPSLNIIETNDVGKEDFTVARRALLFNKQASEEDGHNMEEFSSFNKDEESALENIVDEEPENSTASQFCKMVTELIKKGFIDQNSSKINEAEFKKEITEKNLDELNKISSMQKMTEREYIGKRKFIEPDISDDEESITDQEKKVELDLEEPSSKKPKYDDIIDLLDFEFLNQIPIIHSPNVTNEEEIYTAIEAVQYITEQE